jgi:acetate kinase
MRILVVNAGSSSLKLSVVEDHDRVPLAINLPARRGRVDDVAFRAAVDRTGQIDAVGHRIVHGGSEFVRPLEIDEDVLTRLMDLVDLAPLHQPTSLRAFEAVRRLMPDVPQIGCFDTAFHAHIPAAAATYALPREWRERWNIRRFGFHGLSHAYCARRTAQLIGQPIEHLRMVTCHLGSGASLAAVDRGVSVDTTMGFTPLEGLVMSTRSGSVDPGLILWLEEHVGMPSSELAATLEYRSGLLGLAGSADMQDILEAERAGREDAGLAAGVYLHQLRAGIAAMAAAMNGLDALVFTGGVGENAPDIRARAGAGLGFLGVRIDTDRNHHAESDAEIGSANASVRSFVVRAREDLQIAHDVREVLAERGRPV